jgi:hypothetical protein
MRNDNSPCGSDELKTDGLSISFDEESGLVTLEWDEDSPYADICRAIEQDNSLFTRLLESYLDSLKQDG